MCRPVLIASLALFVALLPVSGLLAQDAPVETAAPVTNFDEAIEAARARMMASPSDALALAQEAETLLGSNLDEADRNTSLAMAWWLQSEALTRLGRPADSLPLAERALEQLGEDPAPTKLYADILLSLGRSNKLTGRHGIALDNYQHAYTVYQAIGDVRSEAIVLQSIGSIYNDARQYERAVEYFSDAAERYQDASLDLAAYNNLGNALTELGQYDEALADFRRARTIAAEMGSPMLEARILNNIASLQIARENFDAADAALDEAFAIAPAANGAEWARFLWGVRAQAAHGRGEDDRALDLIERTFEGVPVAETTQHFTEFHETAAEIYQANGDWPQAIAHFLAFKRLEDEGREFAASANAALVGAQFDFAQQELQIQQLRTQGLEQDLAVVNARTRLRKAVAGGIIAILLMTVIGIFMRQRATRERELLLVRAHFEDVETGLPSRAALERDLQKAAGAHNASLPVIAIEMDRHSHLGSVLGFAKFAELQTRMAERLQGIETLGSISLISPGILGAIPQFVDDTLSLEESVQPIHDAFAAPIKLDGLDIDVSVIVGIARHDHAETGIKNAVTAIQQAHEKRQTSAAFDADLYGDPAQNLTLMSRMLAATTNGDMSLHYQPKLDLRTGTFAAAEALCRWHDPERGFIPPDSFIPQAEETGHIRAFTEWSLRQIVADQKALHAAGFELTLAVNISGSLLTDTEFARRALDLIEDAAGSLSFEITETAMMRDPDRAMANLERWADAGIKLAIDDYGSGFSSLAYLKIMPSRELKLDRAFVTDVAASKRDRMMVKSTVDLAHNLGLELTAEGVETEEGLAILKLMGCDWAQGYLLSKAVPVPGLIDFLGRMRDAGAREIAAPAGNSPAWAG